MSSKYSRGVLLCVTAAACFGGMFPVMTSALKHIDPFTFTCMRYTIAGLVFFGILLWREGRAAFSWKGERMGLAWFLGTSGFVGFQFLVFLGQKLVGEKGALVGSIMMVTQPLLGFFVTWVVRKIAPPKGAIGFILMSLVGVTLVITDGHLSVLLQNPGEYAADGLIVLGALCWVIYTMGASFFPHWSPVKYTATTTALGLVGAYVLTAIIVGTGLVKMPTAHIVWQITPELAYMALIAGVVGVLSWNFGNKALGPLNGVLFMDVVPITAFAISVAEGIEPGNMQFFGAFISACALVLNNLYLRKRATTLAGTPSTAPAPKLVPAVAEEKSGAK